MSSSKKNVAVIGAGPSGLSCLKELLAEGHQAVCFEKSESVGGVYRYDEKTFGVYRSARLTSSAVVTSFSDFPPPKDASPHFKHNEYLKYLTDYAVNFHLLENIRFRHAVKDLRRLADGRWQVTVLNQDNQNEEKHFFDAVAVCTGVHQNPLIPKFPGSDLFKGKTVHSAWYKAADEFVGKNVVVVGGGESGSDIVEEVSKVARSCVLSLRRGVLVIQRRIHGEPNDFYTNRVFYSVPEWFLRIKHKTAMHWPSVVLTILLIMVVVAHDSLWTSLMKVVYRVSPVMVGFLYLMIQLACIYIILKTILMLFTDITIRNIKIIGKFSTSSRAGHGEQFVTKCEGLANAISRYKCQLKPGISKFTTEDVVFEDGTSFKADAVIYCTGYLARFPFLGIEELDTRKLYKNCFDPAVGPTLCFIGLSRPAIGAIPPISEMQSRWFSLIVSGQRQLPAEEQMKQAIAEDAQEHRKTFAVISDRIPNLVDYTSHMDHLAGFVGCLPTWSLLTKDPLLLYRVYFNPFMACQYRLCGPHADKEKARRSMMRMPLGIMRFLYCYAFLCTILVCEVLYRLGLRYFKPKLRLWA